METSTIINLSSITSQSSTLTSTKLAPSEALNTLISEGGDDFYNYIQRIGLQNDPNMIVLSARHHYYYDSDEMKKMQTVINLKELNQIKQIKSLLSSCLYFLPENCNFIGCFINNMKFDRYILRNSANLRKNKKISESVELGITSRVPLLNMIYSVMDLRTNAYMTRSSVSLLLNEYGFKVLDMTDNDGVTFFHSRKAGTTQRLRRVE